MKNRLVNNAPIEGYLYQHKLEKKVTGANSKKPGTEYIRGSIDIATDDAMTNIITIYYSYVVPSDKPALMEKYTILNNILMGVMPNAMTHGFDRASKIKTTPSIELNEFYTSRNGSLELVSSKRLEDGFIHSASELNADEGMRSRFDCDILITGVNRVEADEERGTPEKVTVKGYVFDFRKHIKPVDFVSYGKGIDYFEGLETSSKNPAFTHIKGNIISTVTTRQYEEASAFGEPIVKEVKNTRKEYVITWADPEGPYDIDDELIDVVKNGKVALETERAEAKQRAENNSASRTANAFSSTTKSVTSTTSFDF